MRFSDDYHRDLAKKLILFGAKLSYNGDKKIYNHRVIKIILNYPNLKFLVDFGVINPNGFIKFHTRVPVLASVPFHHPRFYELIELGADPHIIVGGESILDWRCKIGISDNGRRAYIEAGFVAAAGNFKYYDVNDQLMMLYCNL
jgi:hypothetical protein